MNNTKVCIYCGEEKPIEEFRNYYDKPGKYTFCKSCEKLESHRKYVRRRGDAATQEQLDTLEAINKLYDARQAAGLAVPGRRRQHKEGSVQDLIAQQAARMGLNIERS